MACENIVRLWDSRTVLSPAMQTPRQPSDKTVLESQRRTMFSQAIRDYNWQIAETLAASEAEVQDIADSKLRVDIFEEALEQGDSQKASEYAITNREYEKVSALRAASKA